MERNVQWVIDKRVEKTIVNLQKNNIQGYLVQDENELLEKIKELVKEGNTVGAGGSMTLHRAGVFELLKSGNYNFLDRNKKGLTKEEAYEVQRQSLLADTYLTSSNALTEEGELYNVDGYGNRVAAMIFGPEQVIVVVGINKIVKNIEEATKRVERIAAPANTKRLERKTPCATLGYCTDCQSPDRICNSYVIIRKQMVKDRIKVIIVNKELGY
ncbi:Uncharacterised ACR, YkgG family COG1556 [Desulfonispora thiosulfatigenes DSM 11270]|uniref:Uncharacterized ACR, YkgG family COG1556 n=1 Tax=Desulfonispora thiosulfatigenes DSM 11270 TaxID=656914 RepID=A0A1W1VGV5_DESTI|nr:lactate utilization protein [Desulfonispora thiosulfatigenes]SMB92291.1 Uncharacterised ACR, YkgG family COG1556 [Desulfonispora thiosulfatigenes DSM 11270]